MLTTYQLGPKICSDCKVHPGSKFILPPILSYTSKKAEFDSGR